MAATDAYGNPEYPVAGQPVEAAWGSAVVDRVVRIFASAADRTNAIASPDEGQLTYLQTTDRLEVYTNGQWEPVASQGWAASQTALDAHLTAAGAKFSGYDTDIAALQAEVNADKADLAAHKTAAGATFATKATAYQPGTAPLASEPRIVRSASAPSGTAIEGTVWLQYS